MKNLLNLIDSFGDKYIYSWYSADGRNLKQYIADILAWSCFWKRAAKKWRTEYRIRYPAEVERGNAWRATATRRKELLVEVRQLLDAIYAEDIVSSGDLGKVYEKIDKELAD